MAPEEIVRGFSTASNPFPRGVAGSPLAADVITYQLKRVAAADCKVTFTADEMARLKPIFAGGVCDWSRYEPNSPPSR